MTDDFIEDAKDSLLSDDTCCHMLIAAHFGRHDWHSSANVPSLEHLEWMKARFADLCAKIEAELAEDEKTH